jgi:hypothetical protein
MGSAESSTAREVTESGFVRGDSIRYSGSFEAGQAGWIADSTGTTRRLGLTGAENTSSSGRKVSETLGMSESGLVRGRSTRYSGTTEYGSSAWVGTAAGVTTRLGLVDAVHTGTGNYQFSETTALVDAGFVAGYSQRLNGDSTLDGQTAWIYDTHQEQLTNLVFSVRATDGYAYSAVTTLFEDGRAIGNYTLFIGTTNAGSRPFVYLPGLGGFDLGSNMDVSLSTAGWDYFSSGTVQVTGLLMTQSGYIVGGGDPFGNTGSGLFVISTIPEPAAAGFILASISSACAMLRRRSRATLKSPCA